MRIFLKILVILIFSSCSKEQNKNEYDFNKIEQIYIQNRSSHRFGGSKDNYINNKKLIKEICIILNSESKFSYYQTRPFDGTLLIRFLDDEKNIINNYTLSLIYKEKEEYFFSNSFGEFTNHKIKLLFESKIKQTR